MTDLNEKLGWVGADQYKLSDLQNIVTEINVRNGWFDSDRTVGDDCFLLVTEVVEMGEAYRDHGLDDATVPLLNGTDTLSKPEGFGSECADVLIRLLDTCERTGVDLEAEFIRKSLYNNQRGYRHGGKRF